MRTLSELFEFISHCDNDTILKEVRLHCQRVIKENEKDSTIKIKMDVERLNTLFRLMEWYFHSKVPGLIDEILPPQKDELMTVKDVSVFLKTTTITVYSLIKKGKLSTCEISTMDKPMGRPILRIWKSEVLKYLEDVCS